MKRDCQTYRVLASGEPRDLEALNEADAHKQARGLLRPGAAIQSVELLPAVLRSYRVWAEFGRELPDTIQALSGLEAVRITNAGIAEYAPELANSVHAVDAVPVL